MTATVYSRYPERVATAGRRLGRPLTFTEKVLFAHADDVETIGLDRGVDYVDYRPDRVAMQDAMAQMTLLQFMATGRARVAVPSSVHCDHLIRARVGAAADMVEALDENAEVYEFLRSVCEKYGIDFWKPGSGIIHQVVLEQYASPGGMIVGTDSHTPNAGGLGSLAVGVGGADAVDVMAGRPFNTRAPRLIGVHLTGQLSGWAAPKDVILKVAGILTVRGGTGAIVEYFGPGVSSISATGRATICNMGAEVGATGSVFPYDDRAGAYLRATRRGELADRADQNAEYLQADPEVTADPERFFDRVIEVDLGDLEPHLVGPHSPDLDRPIADVQAAAIEGGYPLDISYALVGSCTNSSYEDIGRAAHVARQAKAAGLQVKAPLLITPGSEQIRATIQRDGLLDDLEAIGATVLANACGPCIGQWKRGDIQLGDRNTIVSSFNRNFPRRNDGNADTFSFIGSPETVVAMALTGRLDVDFVREPVIGPGGARVLLQPPVAAELPNNGFDPGDWGLIPPAPDGSAVSVVVKPDSERLELLEPFPAWDARDLTGLPVLFKAVGKCTTDDISPAGPWLRYRGHLTNISQNVFTGVNNAFAPGSSGHGIDRRDGSIRALPDLAREYKQAGLEWMAVGDANYGEGSSREHAAMEPRHVGGRAIIARSFARIHEANLKKQGMLALTFMNPDDYERVLPNDTVDILELAELAPGEPVHVALHHADGRTDDIVTEHTMSAGHIAWFKAGSALNLLRADACSPPADGVPRWVSVRAVSLRFQQAAAGARRFDRVGERLVLEAVEPMSVLTTRAISCSAPRCPDDVRCGCDARGSMSGTCAEASPSSQKLTNGAYDSPTHALRSER